MNKSFYSIYKTFFKIGTLLLGGGYVILPLLQSELAEKKGWISEDELCEYYALSQSVPGIIAANIHASLPPTLKDMAKATISINGALTATLIIIINAC